METIDYTKEAEIAVSSLRADTAKLDSTFDRTASARDKITTKLEDLVDKLTINPDEDKPRDLEVKLALINTATGLLNDIDTQQYKRVSLKAKLDQEENKDTHNKEVVALLKEITLSVGDTGNTCSLEEAEDILNKKFEASELEISETELREDPNDLS